MPHIAIIFPCFNEALRIGDTITQYIQELPPLLAEDVTLSFVLVDDGSTDNTWEVFSALAENYSEVTLCRHTKNMGKGGAIMTGMQEVSADYYAFTDADGAYNASQMAAVLHALVDHNHTLVIGKREQDKQQEGYSWFRQISSRVLTRFVQLVVGVHLDDAQCGIKACRARVVETVLPQIHHPRFSFDVAFLLHAKQQGYIPHAVPVRFVHTGESSVTIKDGIRYMVDVVAISEGNSRTPSVRFYVLLLVLSLSISFAVFGWVMQSGAFFSDDFTWLWYGQSLDSVWSVLSIRMSTFFSPVMNTFYVGMGQLFGVWAPAYFGIGIVVHALVAFFTGRLLFSLTHSRLMSISAACLVAIAGGAYEPLVWIAANMHSIATLFVVIAAWAYVEGIATKKRWYLSLSLISAALAFGTKEIAIVFPAMACLLTVYLWKKYANNIKQPRVYLYWGVLAVMSLIYLVDQYHAQTSGIWVSTGVWQLHGSSLLRLPVAMFDMFFPIGPLRPYLSNQWGIVLWIAATSGLVGLLYRFRRVKEVWFGYGWMLIASLPTVFFAALYIWEPLPSRYTYMPRIGMIIALVAVLHSLIVKNTARYIISAAIWIVIIATCAQLYAMHQITSTEYEYVYNTGRTLQEAMKELKEKQPAQVYIRWDRPFPENEAHMKGAAAVFGNIQEKQLHFLHPGESVDHTDGVLLFWVPGKRYYEIIP